MDDFEKDAERIITGLHPSTGELGRQVTLNYIDQFYGDEIRNPWGRQTYDVWLKIIEQSDNTKAVEEYKNRFFSLIGTGVRPKPPTPDPKPIPEHEKALNKKFQQDRCSHCGDLLRPFDTKYGLIAHHADRDDLHKKHNPHTPGLCSDRCLRPALAKFLPSNFEWGDPRDDSGLYNRLYRRFESDYTHNAEYLEKDYEENVRFFTDNRIDVWTWGREKELGAALKKYAADYEEEYKRAQAAESADEQARIEALKRR